VARRVRVDPQRLLLVLRPVVAQPPAERQHALVLAVQLRLVRDGHVQVQLLRDAVVGPGRRGQRGHVLERDALAAGLVAAGRGPQDQPVAAARVIRAGPRRLIARPVGEPEQLPVELRERPRLRGVEHDLPPGRDAGRAHVVIAW
jgi:hypothetical protein